MQEPAIQVTIVVAAYAGRKHFHCLHQHCLPHKVSHPAHEGYVSPVGAGRASELQDPHAQSTLGRVLGLPCLPLHHDLASTGRQPS